MSAQRQYLHTKLNGSTSQKKVTFSIRVFALTTPYMSYYEAPKIGMKYHHNTAVFHDTLSPGFELRPSLPER